MKRLAKQLFLIFFIYFFVSCTAHPAAIQIGKDNCAFCKMAIADARFGAEVITQKGKIVKYDELHCLLNDIANKTISKDIISEIYFTDFCEGHTLVSANTGFFLRSDELKSPMGGNIAVFLSNDSLLKTMQKVHGQQVSWNELFN